MTDRCEHEYFVASYGGGGSEYARCTNPAGHRGLHSAGGGYVWKTGCSEDKRPPPPYKPSVLDPSIELLQRTADQIRGKATHSTESNRHLLALARAIAALKAAR